MCHASWPPWPCKRRQGGGQAALEAYTDAVCSAQAHQHACALPHAPCDLAYLAGQASREPGELGAHYGLQLARATAEWIPAAQREWQRAGSQHIAAIAKAQCSRRQFSSAAWAAAGPCWAGGASPEPGQLLPQPQSRSTSVRGCCTLEPPASPALELQVADPALHVPVRAGSACDAGHHGFGRAVEQVFEPRLRPHVEHGVDGIPRLVGDLGEPAGLVHCTCSAQRECRRSVRCNNSYSCASTFALQGALPAAQCAAHQSRWPSQD